MVHLDTSFLIRALVPGSSEDSRLREWLGAGEPLGMSAIAWTEFLCGPIDAATEELVAGVVTQRKAFTEDHAAIAARLFNESGRRRGTLIDCMIAATALGDDAAIATANTADFRRFEGSGLLVLSNRS